MFCGRSAGLHELLNQMGPIVASNVIKNLCRGLFARLEPGTVQEGPTHLSKSIPLPGTVHVADESGTFLHTCA
jgi:hypothetical protein